MSLVLSYYHFVFRTYKSIRALDTRYADLLYQYIIGISDKLGCKVAAINGMPDHIHIAVMLKSTLSPAEFMQKIKGSSSRWLSSHPAEFPGFQGWGKEYFGATFSAKDLNGVVSYIKNQQSHHLNQSILDEMRYFYELTGQLDKLKFFFR